MDIGRERKLQRLQPPFFLFKMISKFVPFLLSFLFVLKVAADNPRPDLPNIVFMMADDMGIGDTSAYLGRKASPHAGFVKKTLRTPNLESLSFYHTK